MQYTPTDSGFEMLLTCYLLFMSLHLSMSHLIFTATAELHTLYGQNC